MGGWIGIDLDGTLAQYCTGDVISSIGEPVPAMLEFVKKLLQRGSEVRIFTARVAHDKNEEQLTLIQNWTYAHLGVLLAVTATKDYGMIELYDDRAVGIVPNKGVRADGKPL